MPRSMDIHAIKQALRPSQSQEALRQVQAKLSVKPGELISPHDERLLLAKLWIDDDPEAQGLFSLWEQLKDMSSEALVVSLLSSLLSLLGSQYPFHSYVTPIIKTVLSHPWLRRLNMYLGGSHNERVLVTLQLFNTVSAFAGGQERRFVLEAFPWDNKNLSKLLSMRRKDKDHKVHNILHQPDIRTYYLLLILSMVDQNTVSPVKVKFIEQHGEVFSSIFKGLVQDQYSVVQTVLKVCWEGLWSDPRVKRTLKIAVFNEATILHILKLYDRAAAETQEGEHVLADVAHHFLLAICTHPGHGLCFRDRGWYPWEADDNRFANEDNEHEDRYPRHKGAHAGKFYNKILANILPKLKVNEDPRQQELALRIITACPELVFGYWSTAALSLEPDLSSKWIANIMFVGRVISQAVPSSSFLLPGSNEVYKPTPPPLSTIMANVLPPIGTRSLFTRGLQYTSAAIVRHCTALVLAKCLRKLAEVVRTFKMIEVALEEDEEGLWCRRRKEIETEVRQRAPDFQVVIAFWQQTSASPANSTTHALLSESSQRLLWLYQESLPGVVAEAKFEVGKLLSLISDQMVNPTSEEGRGLVAPALQSIVQFHVLHILRRSDQFNFTASSSHAYLHVLLKSFCDARACSFRDMLRTLLQHGLVQSILFQEHPSDVDIWLAALPPGTVFRGQGAQAPDGTPLTNEVDAVVSFLVGCIQRCLKTPYRYMEESVNWAPSFPPILAPDVCALTSPLLMTVLEQVGSRVNGRLQMPSDILAIFTFIRRLLVMLASKQDEYATLHVILNQLERIIADGQPFLDCPSVNFAVYREFSIARACLSHLEDENCVSEETNDETFATLLHCIEQTPVPESETARIAGAFELIDWLRLVDTKLSSFDFRRLAAAIQRFYEPAAWALVDYLHPHSGHLWELDVSMLLSKRLPIDGAFGWLYLQSTPHQLKDRRVREILLTVLYSSSVTHSYIERAVRLVIYGVRVSVGRDDLTVALLSLLSDILVRAKVWLGKKDLEQLKAHTVAICPTIQGLCISDTLSTDLQKATHGLIAASFDHMNMEDKQLLSPMISHWTERMKESLASGQFKEQWSYIQPWVRFMGNEELRAAVDLIVENVAVRLPPAPDILDSILFVLNQRGLQLPVSELLELQGVFPGSTLLDDMLSATLVSQLPYGFKGDISISDQQSLSTLLSNIQLPRPGKLPNGLISRFLERDIWTGSTGELIVTFLNADIASTQAYATWLHSRQWSQRPPVLFASTLSAFLDHTALSGGDLSHLEDSLLFDLLDQLFSRELCSGYGRLRCLECICKILDSEGDRRPQLVSLLLEDIERIQITNLAFETTFIARKVLAIPGCRVLVSNIIDRVLQWAVRHVSTGAADSEDSRDALQNLEHVAKSCPGLELKSHLVEPLLTTIIQTRLADATLLDLALVLVDNTPLKPVVVNRLLQTILQHQHFASMCGKDGVSRTKNQVARLLHSLFHLHPEKTCQSSHIKPLLHVYGGTLSQFDRCLISIMRLFEATTRTSLSAFFTEWSSSPDSTATNILEVVQGFNPVQILQTCLAFPSWRRFDTEQNIEDGHGPGDDSIYDPAIVIMLTAQMLVEHPPTTAFDWVKLFRSNVVSLLIRCLAMRDHNIRQSAVSQIARIWESLQNTDMQEACQVIYLLRLLKNVILPPTRSGDPPMHLSTYTSLILLHALRSIFYPSNFIYPHTARFLLQRPELDVSDVPMLLGLLYGTSDDWKKERSWMLKLLGDGMVNTDDWKVLKRRHTWELIASLFQNSSNDASVRTWIFGILANLTCNAQACASLVLKSSLLSWIEMQVGTGNDSGKESIAWLRILENIILVADTFKLNRATGGEWCLTICRILSTILQRKDKALGILHQSGTLLLRLSLLQGVPDHALHSTLSQAVAYLLCLEPSIDIHHVQPSKRSTPVPSLPLPPHRAQGLQEMPVTENPLQAWGEAVEILWRVGMSLGDGTHAWTVLTQRLLVWRALVGDEMCPIGEWARKEVVRIGRASICI